MHETVFIAIYCVCVCMCVVIPFIAIYCEQEKGQKGERFGRAVLGILLLQDIAVVPLLVLLPIIETQAGTSTGLAEQLALVGGTVAKGVGGLGVILIAGRFLLRPLFDVVAGDRTQSWVWHSTVLWRSKNIVVTFFDEIATEGHTSKLLE